jgi:catechol 2,3-dioxygenase-like lactoylglutathione lyase family enzyme
MPYPTAALPPRPSLSLLSDRAKSLRKACAAGDAGAIQRVLDYHPGHADATPDQLAVGDLTTRDAQLVVAREHGFDNWTELKRYIDSVRHADGEERPPTRIGKAVPFLAVADMTTSLLHYVERLGFRMTRHWAPDGQVRWCWLEHGSAALMLQQYDTEGQHARTFEAVRGAGAAFAFVADRGVGLGDLFDGASDLGDADGYVLRDPHGVLAGSGSATTMVPVFDVSNLAQSAAFYRDILGYHEVGGVQGESCRLQRDDADVLLRQGAASATRRGRGVGLFHMCHDTIAYYREVAARGGPMDEPQVGNRLWVAQIRDPDGWNLAYESPTDAEEGTRLSDVESRGALT